jgi:hypothetical protein
MSLDYEILHENVYYFPKAIPDIQNLLIDIENFHSVAVSPWGTWYANDTPDSYAYGDVKTFMVSLLKEELDPEKYIKAESIIFSLLGAIENTCAEYLKKHGASQEELDFLKKCLYEDPYRFGIRKYNPGESMGPHQDMVDPNRDTITISVYLNDEYEGGEIAVVEGDLNIAIKAKAGSIVIFPSNYRHESRLLKSGRKMLITHVHMPIDRVIK